VEGEASPWESKRLLQELWSHGERGVMGTEDRGVWYENMTSNESADRMRDLAFSNGSIMSRLST
jgi:hypothetical protein